MGERSLDLTINNYAVQTGDSLFLPINLLNKRSFNPVRLEERKSNILLKLYFFDTDTITHEIPEDYKIEYLPEGIEMITHFGEYTTTIKAEKRYIYYVRTIEMNRGIYPKESCPKFRKFYEDIVEADKMQAFLVKNKLSSKGWSYNVERQPFFL